jgi:LCP family protein required for cell wall assembly
MGIKTVDIRYQQDSRKSEFDWVSILLIFLAIGIIVGAIYFLFYFRESKVAVLIESNSILSTLIVETNGEKTEALYLGFYNPETHKVGVIVMPENTRLKVDYEDKPVYDSIEKMYHRGGMNIVRSTIEGITGNSFDYYLAYDVVDVERFVDLLEGIALSIPNSLNYTDVENKIFIKIRKGDFTLDGAKARELLLYKYGQHGQEQRMANHRLLLEALVLRAEDIGELLHNRRVISRVLKDADTNFSIKDLRVLVGEMNKVNSSRILFLRMFGKNTVIQDTMYITPIENGRWLTDRIANLKKFISDEGPAPIDDEISIEILNGSGNPGQAQGLRNSFLEYGFNVVHFGNALRNDYENTIVIDRVGNPALAKKVADIINCKEVYTRVDKTLLVDVTIIIGNDFEGKYVR